MAKLDRDALMVQDMDLARETLLHEDKKPDEPKLAKDIHEDWEILSRARHLPEAVKEEVTQAVYRIVKSQRALARRVLPPGILEKNLDFYRLMLALNGTLAQKKDKTKDADDMAVIARMKRTIARDIIKPRLVRHVDESVNGIIDDNNEMPLEDIIERVIAHLKNECLGKNVTGVSFYLVNEENYHGQVDKLTKTSIGIPAVKMDRADFEEDKEGLQLFGNTGTKPRTTLDRQTNKMYFELKINGRQLGLLEIDLKPGTELSDIETQYIGQAMSRLDSKIDEALHSKRLDVIARKAHRILDEHGTKEKFEEGIAEFMELVCLYSTAYEAEVMVDIFGDGKDWFAKRFNDDREITPIEMDSGMKAEVKIPSTSRRVNEKRALVLDIIDTTNLHDSDEQREIIGKVIFRTKKGAGELTNEDHTILTLCSEILSSHMLTWRNDLKLRTEGVDPQIARTTMRNGMADIVKETLTVFYTDIAGYTYICEILKEALEDEDTMQDIETLRAVLEEFLNLIQKTGQMYGGVWDKAVGDMGLMEFGTPIDQNGKDPLGHNATQRRPEFFANNALKAALLVRHKLGEVSQVFRTKLLEIAHKKYTSGLKKLEDLDVDEQNALLKKLEDETRLSPKIATTTSVYTGDVGFMRLKLGAADDWTAIGDPMNSAARVQGSSLKMEIRIPLLTRDLVAPLMNMNQPIPFNDEGGAETWAEFFKNRLGIDPEKVEVQFIEHYEGHKNKAGRNVTFTVSIKERRCDGIAPKSRMQIDKLLEYEGEEFAIESRKPSEGNMISFKLKTVHPDPAQAVSFYVDIPQAAIEERVVRYKSPQALAKRTKSGSTNSLLVQNGKLVEFVWKSIEEDQDKQLEELADNLGRSKEKMVVYTKTIPTGCYELNNEKPDKDPNHTVLSIRKGNHIFDVRVNNCKILSGPGAIIADADTLYDFQSFYETIRGSVNPGNPVVFVRKRKFYKIDPADAELYLMPIRTRTETDMINQERGSRTSSTPPARSNSIMPSAPSTLTSNFAPKGTSKFWSTIAEQVEQLKKLEPESRKEFFAANWESNITKED